MHHRSFQPNLLRMTYFKAPPVSRVRPYVIPARTALVELVTEGVVYFRSGNRELTLGCGALFWHLAGDETIHRTEAGSPYACLALSFTAPVHEKRAVSRLSVIKDHQRTWDLCRELLRAYHDESVDRSILGNYAHSRFLWEAHSVTLRHSVADHPPAVEAALAFLESGFRRPDLGIRDLAKSVRISEPHLFTLFQRHVAQTPHQFLIARRIREAKWMLSGTDSTIKAIAQECGFTSIETFYRAFKRVVGTAPHQFRKGHSVPILENRK